MMNFSYWEQRTWFSNIDFTIVGSGIVGLNTALSLKARYPKAKILILERGILPNGASTKNAGFACFGSLSEIIEDLKNQPREDVLRLIRSRIKGLALMRSTLGDQTIGYRSYGGYEIYTEDNKELYEECLEGMEQVNSLLFPIFEKDVFSVEKNHFGFQRIQKKVIYSAFEAQINTGRMMEALLQKAQAGGIKILNNITVEEFEDNSNSVEIKTNLFNITTGKLLIATNGFAHRLGIPEVGPARAQVLITKPIQDLHIKGTFHLDKGFYYFRNINNRVLLGGGRNLDFKAEETTRMVQTARIQKRLEELLKYTILPDTAFEIEQRWSGIMGVGNEKKPIIKKISNNVYCGVRLGGMGVAIGSLIGRELAELIE